MKKNSIYVWHLAHALLCLFLISLKTFAQSPISISVVAEVPAPFSTVPQTIISDALNRPYYYLAAKSGGLQVFDIQNISTPQLVKTIGQGQLGGLEVSDVFQRGNLLYLALGNFFGNNPQIPGLAILDISNPNNPVIVDTWVSTTANKGSGFVLVEGSYAYLGAMANGFIILDIHTPDSIKFVSQTLPDPDFPIPNPMGPEVPRGRGMAIRDSLLYLCFDAGGLRVMNVSDKLHPVEIGRYLNPGTAGKQQAFNNIFLHGNLAYVAVDYCGLEILDISDPAEITQTGWWNPWACETPSNAWVGSPGHSNQIALDTANKLIFLSSGQSELSIVDVSVPGQPLWVGGHGTADDNVGTWGMTLRGDRVYLTYILSFIPFASNWAGVKILDWSITTKAVEPENILLKTLYPNPFTQGFAFELELENKAHVQAKLVDIFGKTVALVADRQFEAGIQQVVWEGQVPTGIYTLWLDSPEFRLAKKVVKMGGY